jgi:predicted RNA-binding protein associated with RNAse of E/G family
VAGHAVFEAGQTVVRRDVFRGRMWSAQALRVVRDTPEALIVACRPGAEGLAPTTWIASLLNGGGDGRQQALLDLASGDWRLASWRWRSTVLLLWNPPGTYFSVNAFYDPADNHRLDRWYVNFQRPWRRTAIGFDTFDLLVDLVVAPDRSGWVWKDEDEYAQARRLGVVSEADHAAVEAARGQVVAMIEHGDGPFASEAGWDRWHSDPSWPAPVLPPAVDLR